MPTATKPAPYPYEYRTELAKLPRVPYAKQIEAAKQWLGSRYLLASEGKPMPAMIRRQAG